jgi:PhnB protein
MAYPMAYLPSLLVSSAMATGASAVMPPADMFWGDRYGILTDPLGHQWSIATHTHDFTPEQIQKSAVESACCGSAKS